MGIMSPTRKTPKRRDATAFIPKESSLSVHTLPRERRTRTKPSKTRAIAITLKATFDLNSFERRKAVRT